MSATEAISRVDWKRFEPPPILRISQPGTRAYRRYVGDGYLSVFVGREMAPGYSAPMWHLSISHPDRYPEWDEIVEARYRFIPDEVRVAQLLPPRAEWVNVHPTTMHLWEIEEGGAL
jgi:hypothetical protein